MAIHSDSFDILRNCRLLFIRRLGALLQDSRLVSGAAVAAIQDGAGAYFDEVIATSKRGNFADEVDGLTASRITLLAEDDLELGIRLDNLTARLFDNSGDSLWKLHLRFVTLLRRPELPKSDNPVGPKGICRGLDTLFGAAGAGSLDDKLNLLDQFEAYLRQNLPPLYTELNAFLENAGIDTAQPAIVTAPGGPTSARENPAATSDALAGLQQLLAARLPAMPQGAVSISGGAAASLLSQSALEQLMFRLEALERLGRFGPPVLPGSTPANEPMMPALFADGSASEAPKIIRSSELGIPKSATESVAIDTLAMIFEAIFADPELPDALKAIISSLQIKVLKMAMKDSTLFTDSTHPARLVLDRMAEAAQGLPLDVSPRHPVCVRLFELASHLRLEPGSDKEVFATTLGDLDALITRRREQIAADAARYQPLLEQLDRQDVLASRVTQIIRAALQKNPPEPVRHFLDRTWRQALLHIGREAGPDSPPWQEYAAAIDELLWSLLPKTAAEERKQLAQRVPPMLRTLKAGMERAGLPNSEQEAFLDTCFQLQTQALRATAGTSTENTGSPPVESSERGPSEPVSSQLRSGDLVLLSFDFPEPQSPPARAPAYAPGDWVAAVLGNGEPRTGMVGRISPDTRRVLLLNPETGLAAAVHPAILDRQFRDGSAEIRSGRSLFDLAAQRALGQAGKQAGDS